MVKNSHSLQPKLSKNHHHHHHQNRAVEVASLSKRTLRNKVRFIFLFRFQSKKNVKLSLFSSHFGSLHRPIHSLSKNISHLSIESDRNQVRASAEHHRARFASKKINQHLPFPPRPPQKYGLYHYSLCLRQVPRLSRIRIPCYFPVFHVRSLPDGLGAMQHGEGIRLGREARGNLGLTPQRGSGFSRTNTCDQAAFVGPCPLGTSLVQQGCHRSKR